MFLVFIAMLIIESDEWICKTNEIGRQGHANDKTNIKFTHVQSTWQMEFFYTPLIKNKIFQMNCDLKNGFILIYPSIMDIRLAIRM